MTRCSIGLISTVALAALFTAPMPAAAEKTVKVFILAGQSNMVGHGKVEMGRNPDYVKGKEGSKREIKGGMACLRTLATDPKTAAKYKPWLGADGKWVEREDVLIYSTAPGKKTGKLSVGFGKGGWFGPELGFGHVVQGERIWPGNRSPDAPTSRAGDQAVGSPHGKGRNLCGPTTASSRARLVSGHMRLPCVRCTRNSWGRSTRR
jgi:hypothetical protein